jgi:hypothetical protein
LFPFQGIFHAKENSHRQRPRLQRQLRHVPGMRSGLSVQAGSPCYFQPAVTANF